LKTVFLTLLSAFVSLQVFAQDSGGEVFLGHWTNPESNVSMVVYKDVFDRYQVKQWSLEDGEMYTISDVHVTGQVMLFNSYNPATKITSVSKFYKQGDDDMEETINGPAAVPLIIDWIRETP
jgi:hypothetical protein